MTGAAPNPSPRICLLTDSFHPVIGGGENHALLLCREFLRRGVSVFVLTRRIRPDLPRRESLDGLPILRVPPSGFPRLGKYLMVLPTFLALVRQRKAYDLIYVCSFRVAGIPAVLAAAVLGKACVLRAESRGELSGDFIWQSPDPSVKGTRLRPLIRAYLRLRNRLLLKADAFVSISRDIDAEYRREAVPEDRIELIFNGIDTERFAPAEPARRAELRRKLGLPGDRRLFTYTGKLNKGKGLELLLRAWRRLGSEGAGGDAGQAHLLLVGGGGGQFLSCEAELRAYAAEHQMGDRITFAGFQGAIHEYLQASDAFVFPSENEALSIALLEALASGLPCLASDIPGNRDILEDGRDGTLLPVNDEAAWVRAVLDVMAAPERYAAMAQRGHATAAARFSIRRVADLHLELFRRLAAPDRSGRERS